MSVYLILELSFHFRSMEGSILELCYFFVYIWTTDCSLRSRLHHTLVGPELICCVILAAQ